MALPRFDVEFTREGRLFRQEQADALLAGLGGATDLLVLCHGWNNDMTEARGLYDGLLQSFETVRAAVRPGDDRTFVVAQLFWPSKKFSDEQLIPGGGAVAARAANDAALTSLLEELARDPERLPASADAVSAAADTPAVRRRLAEQAIAQSAALETPEGRERFLWHLRALLDPSQASEEDGSDEFFAGDPETLFAELSEPVLAPLPVGAGGAAAAGSRGGAVALGDFFDGFGAAARRLANFSTYYQMKDRAGKVGSSGIGALLRAVRQQAPALKLHLVGHSFGARAMTAAAMTLPPSTGLVTLTLLQAAYSHNGLAENWTPGKNGFFRSVLAERRVSGPVAVTHTKNDSAVGIAYPLASRIANQKAAALGDANDPYGGMGRNGALHTPEAQGNDLPMGEFDAAYVFAPGKVYNLLADRFISGHSAVTGPEVAAVILAVTGSI